MRDKYFLKLRGAVAEKGYNLRILAQELNISQQALNEKLYGRKQFTLEEMLKTCNYLDAAIDIFFDSRLHNLKFTEASRTA